MLNAPDLTRSWKAVVLALLEKIRKTLKTETCAYPWLLRADGEDLSVQNKDYVTHTATSISFPSFKLGPLKGHETDDDLQHFPMMSLFQWFDPSDAAKEWDCEQVFSRMAGDRSVKDQIVFIPHIWSLVFNNSNLIILSPGRLR